MNCYDCELWEQGMEDGTCIHYLNNTCPYGYSRKKDMELLEDLRLELQEQR
jgi:hypothetical protein